MDAELKQALEAMETRINKRFDQFEERIHDAQTRLLSVFEGHSAGPLGDPRT
jgi:hypothetical protein